MKKLIVTLFFGLILGLPFAEVMQGQKIVNQSTVKWKTGANTGKTRIRLYTGNTYLDTSATGQAGAWKRIDNTADSCSQAFLIAADSIGSTRPIWEFSLWELVKTVNAASSHVFRVNTREMIYDNAKARQYLTPWTVKGTNNGYSDVVIQDSVLMAAQRVTGSKVSQYSLFAVSGTLARLCPDEVGSTSTSAGDSIIIDSIRVRVR